MQRPHARNRSDAGTASVEGGSTRQEARGANDGASAAPDERDSGRRSQNRSGHARVSGATGSDAGASDSRESFSKEITRAVMAGTGEVLAADMADSTALYVRQDWAQLRARLRRDGYLLLRGVLPTADVLKVGPPSCFSWPQASHN